MTCMCNHLMVYFKLLEIQQRKHPPVLDEVLLEPAGDLLVGERGDGDHCPELAVQSLVKPIKLLVAPGHLGSSDFMSSTSTDASIDIT